MRTIPAGTHLSPTEATQAILTLNKLEARLGADSDKLSLCIGFTKDALWAAAYPDDPNSMLDLIAGQADNALG